MIYSWYKLIHIVSLILWLAPATGAYWILIRWEKSSGSKKFSPLEKYYEEVLIMEHLAFVLLLVSGWGLWKQMGVRLFDLPWLKMKLTLVAMIGTIEIFDIGLSHIYFRVVTQGHPLPEPHQWKKFLKIRGIFYWVSIPLLLILILSVMALAIFKPSQIFNGFV